MKTNKNSKKKINQKEIAGITLIALVITIIVLLILAGISISMLSGDNSILNQAGRARNITGQKDVEERIQLAYMAAISNGLGDTTKEKFEDELKNEFGKDKVTDLADDFSTVKIDGKEYETGISDAGGGSGLTQQADGTFKDSKDNEWVWIEVPKSVTASVTEDNDIYDALRDYCKDVIAKTGTDYKTSTAGFTDSWYDGCGLGEEEYNTTKSKMLNSIKDNGGFYIGKYETGIDDSSIESTATTTAGLRTSSGDTTQTAVIKQNKQPYTYVTCSQAETLAKGFATDGKTASLLFGIQWDLVLKFIKVKESLSDNTILTSNSTTWGNYYNKTYNITNTDAWYSTNYGANWTKGAYNKTSNRSTLLTTGAHTDFSKQKIYDFAGNVYEWTLEQSSNSSIPCAIRGGGYRSNGDRSPASYRSYNLTSGSVDDVGFRVALYL